MIDASPYIGIPYEYKGSSVSGCDCWGLVRLVYARERHVSLPSFDEYHEGMQDTQGINAAVVEATTAQWRSLAMGEEVSGDVVVLRVSRLPVHVGIVVDADAQIMMHVMLGRHAVTEPYNGTAWRRRVAGIYRYG